MQPSVKYRACADALLSIRASNSGGSGRTFTGRGDGGRGSEEEYSGRNDFIFNLDSGQARFVAGRFFNFEIEGNWASAVNSKTGAPITSLIFFLISQVR